MPILGSPKTRFGIRAMMEQVGGPYDTKTESEVSVAGELIICDDITEIKEEEK